MSYEGFEIVKMKKPIEGCIGSHFELNFKVMNNSTEEIKIHSSNYSNVCFPNEKAPSILLSIDSVQSKKYDAVLFLKYGVYDFQITNIFKDSVLPPSESMTISITHSPWLPLDADEVSDKLEYLLSCSPSVSFQNLYDGQEELLDVELGN